MICYDKNKPLISLHIPKTAGTAFRKILKTWYKDNLFYHYFDEQRGILPVKHRLAPGICIHGHFNKKRNFGVNDYYPEVNQFITFLRDPFEILISRYFFVKKRIQVNKSYRNGAQLMLEEDVNKFLKKEILKTDYHPNILDYFPFELTKSDFETTLFKNFVFIGIVDEFQKSIDRLANKLGFQTVQSEYVNVSERYLEVDYSLKELFIKVHPLEYRIFQFVREINL